MKEHYSFLSEIEPSDEELQELMYSVLQDVKHRATIANQKFDALQLKQIREAFQVHQKSIEQNDQK